MAYGRSDETDPQGRRLPLLHISHLWGLCGCSCPARRQSSTCCFWWGHGDYILHRNVCTRLGKTKKQITALLTAPSTSNGGRIPARTPRSALMPAFLFLIFRYIFEELSGFLRCRLFAGSFPKSQLSFGQSQRR